MAASEQIEQRGFASQFAAHQRQQRPPGESE
jgi:hypothetical protein